MDVESTVPGDGHYDADQDALTDLQELNLTVQNPANGGLSPPDAPRMWEEAMAQNENAFLQRINSMLFAKGNRAMIAAQQYLTGEAIRIFHLHRFCQPSLESPIRPTMIQTVPPDD